MKVKGIEELISKFPGKIKASERLSLTEGYNYAVSVFSRLKPDEMPSDVSLEDECVFIFLAKDETRVFFNIFPEDEYAVVNMFWEDKFLTMEGCIRNTADLVVEKLEKGH